MVLCVLYLGGTLIFSIYIRGSSQLIVDIFNNLSTVSAVLKIIACS